MNCTVRVALVLVAVVVGLAPALAAAQVIRYAYDPKGQLVGVIDSDGSAATYQWSETGNLLGVTRTDAGSIPTSVGITLVNPSQTLPQAVIEIFGKGFSTTPSANTVTFYNGAVVPAGDILTATPNYLQVKVPPNANTGPVQVTVAGVASNAVPFTVPAAMTINPGSVALLPTRTQQFGASGPVTWTVNGIVNGSPQTGTISAGGLYTAPASGTFPLLVRIGAFTPGNPQNKAEALVTILPVPVARAAGVSVARGPVITAVHPPSLAPGAAKVPLTLTGQGLGSPTAFAFLKNGTADANITVEPGSLAATADGTQARAVINVLAAATTGGRTLQLTAGALSTPAATGRNAFEVGPPVLFADDFTRPDDTNLGAAWTEVAGNWTITANQLALAAASGVQYVRIAATLPQADYRVQAQVTPVSGIGYVGIFARFASTSAYYLLRHRTDTNSVALLKNGTTFLGQTLSPNPALQNGTTYALRLTVQGTTLTADFSADGGTTWVQVTSTTDSTHAGPGYAGVLGSNSSASRADGFSVVGLAVALPTVTIVATDPTASETGDPATFTVTRTGSTLAPLTVAYTVGGTATAGTDYTTLPGTLTIPAGSASAPITVLPLPDLTSDPGETVIVTLAPGSVYLLGAPGTQTATATLGNVDRPTVTIVATTPTAPEAGPTPGTFTVTRTGPTTTPLTVYYTVTGTATPVTDYAALPGILTLPAGASSAPIAVTPVDDTAVEGNETVIVTLSDSAAYIVGSPASATVTIVDDDGSLPTVTVVATDPTATEAGPTTGTFTVTRTGSTANELTVYYSTASGTAIPGTDYVALPGSVTIPAGAASAPITVTPIDDTLVDGDKTVIVTLTADAAYTVGAPPSDTVTITDNDLFFDDFNRTDSTNLGSQWTELSGDWTITANQLAQNNTATGGKWVRTATAITQTDYKVQSQVTPTSGIGYAGVTARLVDTNNYYTIRLRVDLNNVSLFRVQGGTFTLLGAAYTPSPALQLNTTYALRLTVQGTQITGEFSADGGTNWVPVASAADSTFAGPGYAGVLGSNNTLKADNFNVTKP